MWVTRWLYAVATVVIFAFFTGCSGAGPGPGNGGGTLPAAPAPPLEIPQFLRFPADVGIDVSSVGQTNSGSTLLAQATATDVKRAASAGPSFIKENNELLMLTLLPVSQTEIPVDPQQTSFQETITLSGSGTPLDIDVKIDFSTFDLDGDGVNEDCSGSTCPVTGTETCPAEAPADEIKNICFRVWLNDKRFMAGVFTHMPDDDSIGAGEFFNTALAEFGDDSFEFHTIYDHVDPDNRSTTTFMGIRDNDAAPGDPPSIFNHTFVGEEVEGTQNKKTIRIASILDETAAFCIECPDTQQYNAKFIEGIDLVGLHLLINGFFLLADDSPTQDISPAVCAQASTGALAGIGTCEDLSIDVTSEPFLDFATEADVGLPNDFPTTPPQ